MDNKEEKEIVESKKKGNGPLIAILVLIIIGLVVYIAYDKLVIDMNDKVEETKKVEEEKEQPKEDDKKKEENENQEKEKTTSYTLFNEEVIISNKCPNYNCDKKLGTFTLGDTKHEASLLFKGNHGSEDYESYIIFENDRKIELQNKYSDEFDKIVKIGEDYLAIGTMIGPNIGYSIKIYDSNLNRIKDFSSLKSVPMKDSFKDYFNVEGNTFTRYSCDTSKDTGDGTNQFLVKYLVTVNNGNFEEKEVSRVNEYCSAQS